MKFDYGFEEAQRLAALEDELGEIGGGSAIGGWAQAKRRHNEAVKALHALSEAFGLIADHAVFAALHSVDSWAMVHVGKREFVSIRIANGSERDYEVRMHSDGFIAHVDAVDARPTALRALRAAVDARLTGADWPAVVEAARHAANGGER